jgi:transglutaminase-like putative cysteine protease
MARGVAVAMLGMVVISQLLLGWIPGPARLWQGLRVGNWPAIPGEVADSWRGFGERALLWWQGVQAGGAAQDNLVFGALACCVLWVVGALGAWLARRSRQGYLAAAPSLWLLGTILLYSSSGKYLLVLGLALTILLQLLLDHELLVERWNRLHLDYSPGLLTDRMLSVISAAVLVLTVAAVMPNLYITPLVRQYYAWIAPLNERAEALAERLFPDLHATSRLRGGGLGGGLPNEFLLQGGPNVSRVEVMRVRTNEAGPSYAAPYEDAPPPGRTMRGGTLTVYDGHGWSNPSPLTREDIDANTRFVPDEPWGRKLVVQSVILEFGSTILYAAAEPIEVSTPVQVEQRGGDDLVAVYSRERSYTVISTVPAVDEAMLRDLPEWGAEMPLPGEMEIHRVLPETITQRTRDLAAEIMAGQATAYDRMAAIESYLRQYEYDLDVPPPPADVSDVADYFLFDLRRGYCDYYATAFVVLARLAGMPARFATGFAAGSWDPAENLWVVTEAEAHSWPEVYFPQVGWIPFEPTAGRPALARVADPQFALGTASRSQAPSVPALPEVQSAWNWQTALWLLPLALVIWALVGVLRRWQQRREDPWTALLRWGRRAGRPIASGETVLEYGSGLADFVTGRSAQEADTGRIVAREVRALSGEVSALRYGPEPVKAAAQARSLAHWERLRHYLRGVRGVGGKGAVE